MRTKALVVDDAKINRDLLCDIVGEKYTTLEAENGEEALRILDKENEEIAVVLLDVVMPKMDGFGVLKAMNEKGYTAKIPVLFITGETAEEIEQKGFEMGISDLIRKPFNEILVNKRIENIVEMFTYKNSLEDKVEEQTEILRKQYKLLKKQADKLKDENEKIIDILANVVEYRNLESGQHVKRVKGFTGILAEHVKKEYPEYGLTDEDVEIIVATSALHDVGKIAIPDSILLKPGRFTDEEYEYMKSHTTKGHEILKNLEEIWDEKYRQTCYQICRHHHERYDGRGYPDGLKGDDIPIAAQIVSIADVYDALVSERVYKAAYTKSEAYNMILRGECGVFSPKLIECFRNARSEFERLADDLSERSQ